MTQLIESSLSFERREKTFSYSSDALKRAEILRKDIFSLTSPYIDKEGSKIQLWSIPGPDMAATIHKVDGTFRIVRSSQIKNSLNPDDTSITLHNRLLNSATDIHLNLVVNLSNISKIEINYIDFIY